MEAGSALYGGAGSDLYGEGGSELYGGAGSDLCGGARPHERSSLAFFGPCSGTRATTLGLF